MAGILYNSVQHLLFLSQLPGLLQPFYPTTYLLILTSHFHLPLCAEPLQPGEAEYPWPSPEGCSRGREPREGDGASVSDRCRRPTTSRRQAHTGAAQERWHQGEQGNKHLYQVNAGKFCIFCILCLCLFHATSSVHLHVDLVLCSDLDADRGQAWDSYMHRQKLPLGLQKPRHPCLQTGILFYLPSFSMLWCNYNAPN